MDWSFLALSIWNLLAGMVRHARTLPHNLSRHAARARILDTVSYNPGKTFARICDELSLNRGTAAYHLYVLERAGAIESLSGAHTRHFFPKSVEPLLRPAVAVLQRERSLEVAVALLSGGAIEQGELLERIRMDRKVWKPYRRELLREGLVLEERKGRRVRYHATPKLARLVDIVQGAARPKEPSK